MGKQTVEYQRAYRALHRAEVNANQRDYRRLNRSKTRGYEKRYYLRYGERIILRQKNYRASHPHLVRAHNFGLGIDLARIIQLVYEDNIKKYGTLTCYLCFRPVAFGDDHLEHRVPISRGGKQVYENMGVSCSTCNMAKGIKTEEEYRHG